MASPFPQFSSLPPELRAIIWELCLPTHVIRLSTLAHTTAITTTTTATTPFSNRRKPPLISQVCHESRALALAHHPSRRRPCDKTGL